MGNSNSKRSRVATYPSPTAVTSRLNQSSGATLTGSTHDFADAGSTLSVSAVCKWEDKLLSDPKVWATTTTQHALTVPTRTA